MNLSYEMQVKVLEGSNEMKLSYFRLLGSLAAWQQKQIIEKVKTAVS